jgi:hypothetical protein
LADQPNAIWTPDGVLQLGEKKAERVELRPGVMEWLRQFTDVAQALHLGMHCARCHTDLVGRNSDSDKRFTVMCECREFTGENRDYRPQPEPRQH